MPISNHEPHPFTFIQYHRAFLFLPYRDAECFQQAKLTKITLHLSMVREELKFSAKIPYLWRKPSVKAKREEGRQGGKQAKGRGGEILWFSERPKRDPSGISLIGFSFTNAALAPVTPHKYK